MIDPLELMEKDNQAKAISFLLKSMKDAAKRREDLDKAIPSLEGNPDLETVAKFLRTTMKVIKPRVP